MAWVRTERQSLGETLRSSDPDAPTLCAGWDTRHLLAHLVQREHSPAGSLGDVLDRRPPGEEKYLGRLVAAARSPEGYAALVDRFLAGPPRWSPMRLLDENANLVEYVIHHEDVRRGNGPVAPRSLPDEEGRAIWAKLGLFGRLTFRRSPVGVALAWSGGPRWVVKKGPTEVTVTGSPVELALYVSGRRAAATVELSGPAGAVSSLESFLAAG